MKIDLESIDKESFMVHTHNIGEHEVTLVQPIHIGATWTKDNLIFRSSVWDKEGNPVSLSFKKFFNWDEKPEIDPAPNTLEGAKLIEKLDRSAGLAYQGVLSLRRESLDDAERQLLESYELNRKQTLAIVNLIPTYVKRKEFKKALTFGDLAYKMLPKESPEVPGIKYP